MEESKEPTTLENNTKSMQTYIIIGTQETGTIEIDLVSYRQRNEKRKYLTIEICEPLSDNSNFEQDVENKESRENGKKCLFALDNEMAFLQLKNFFSQLTWDD